MADQQRWFKFWCSAPSDDDLQALPPALRWAWAAFGAYTKQHGTSGVIKVSPSNLVLAAQMGVQSTDLIKTIALLPHIYAGTAAVTFPHGNQKQPVCAGEFIRCGVIESSGVASGCSYPLEEWCESNGEITVTWHNWKKYQEDSTVAERQKRFREKTRNGLRREEKRRDKDKKRKEQEKGANLANFKFESFWKLYPKRTGKKQAFEQWNKEAGLVEDTQRVIMTALSRQIEHRAKLIAAAKFAPEWPDPVRWLKHRRWEDELHDPGEINKNVVVNLGSNSYVDPARKRLTEIEEQKRRRLIDGHDR